MRRFLALSLLTSLALAGCGSPTVTLVLDFDTTDQEEQTVLLQAATRVIGRRLSRWEGVTPEKITATPQGSGSTLLAFDVTNAEARRSLVEELQRPFSLQIMLRSAEEKGLPTEAQASGGERGAKAGDLYVEEQGWFNETGITERHIAWVDAATEADGKRGAVRLNFTEDGRALFANLVKANPKGILGLFVRGTLMSKMQIEGTELNGDITIREIPNALLADIFADDVNVGTHVTFSLPSK